jgi:hypothetical protein
MDASSSLASSNSSSSSASTNYKTSLHMLHMHQPLPHACCGADGCAALTLEVLEV